MAFRARAGQDGTGMPGHRTLRSRLFSWFVGAILLALLTGSLVAFTTRPETGSGAEAMARNVGAHLASIWDDPGAVAAYVAEVRDVTGFDAQLVRDSHRLTPHMRRAAERGAALLPDGPAHVYVPILRSGALVGALEIDRFGTRAAPWQWWRFAFGLVLVVALLSAMAGAVANQLARPLERLAWTADRFGGGDLSARTRTSGDGPRWVAREVADVARSFNRMADRVEAMVRGQRELLGAISHELRSPLGRARVALEIVRERLPSAPHSPSNSAGSALDDIEKELVAIDNILRDLLDVTRAGLSDLRKQTHVFGDWVRHSLAEEPPTPPIDLTIDADVSDLALAFDAPLVARALHNLLRNARAHGHPGDVPIEVGLARLVAGGRTYLRLVVHDRGPGFPDGFAEKAFEPFVRGDGSRTRPSEGAGYGLGLAIVRRVIEAHGGSAFARNAPRPPGGAIVGFDLPIVGASG